MGTVLDDHGLRAAGRALESARLAAGGRTARSAVPLGLTPESLLSAATKKPLTEIPAQPAAAVPISLEAPAAAKPAPTSVGAPKRSPAAARRRTRARSGGLLHAVSARSSAPPAGPRA